MPRLAQGFLVAIEGIDGSGKSTLARALATTATESGFSTVLTKEPGGTPLGMHVRSIVHEQAGRLDHKAEFLLFAADRAHHITTVIKPALAQQHLIITDRFADSSLVYQGFGRGLAHSMITAVNEWVLDGIKPACTFYVRIDAQTAYERICKRDESLSGFEMEHRSFTQRLIDGFETLYTNQSHVIILDGTQAPALIAQQAWHKLISLLTPHFL